MKKLITITTIALACVSLTACSSKPDPRSAERVQVFSRDGKKTAAFIGYNAQRDIFRKKMYTYEDKNGNVHEISLGQGTTVFTSPVK